VEDAESCFAKAASSGESGDVTDELWILALGASFETLGGLSVQF
jgi:hypothetical protein